MFVAGLTSSLGKFQVVRQQVPGLCTFHVTLRVQIGQRNLVSWVKVLRLTFLLLILRHLTFLSLLHLHLKFHERKKTIEETSLMRNLCKSINYLMAARFSAKCAWHLDRVSVFWVALYDERHLLRHIRNRFRIQRTCLFL